MNNQKKPLNILFKNMNKSVVVKLKNNAEYRGRMTKCDNYMNIIMDGAIETHNSNPIANYGNIFIRGNNVLYICFGVNEIM